MNLNTAFFLLLANLTSAELIDVSLNLTPATPSENTLNLALAVTIFTSSSSSQASGSVEARIEIDPASGEISTLEFLSGNISATPVTFVSGFGNFGYNLQSTTLGATIETLSPPSNVTAGQSPADEHQLTINSGTLTGTALGDPIPPQDFATNSVSGTGAAGTFATVSATENASLSSTTLKVYDLDITFPIALAQAVPVTETLSADITANGNIRATGQTSFPIAPPNPYLAWAATNGISDAPFTGNDFSDTLPSGLFWALGYEADEVARNLAPLGDGTFNLALPTGGTVADVAVQLSFDLSNPNGWSTISTISAGTTGVQGPYGGGSGPAFLRLLVADPAE